MSIVLELDNQDLEEFAATASAFGTERYGYVVTPNVDHLIRYHDDPGFRAAYADAAYVLLDSRFLYYLLRAMHGVRPSVCTGSDLTAKLFSSIIDRGDRVVMIGASSHQAEFLRRSYHLDELRHFNPPMNFIHDERELEQVLQFIEKQSPFRFCLLAVGSPQQEVVARKIKQRGQAKGLALCIGASVNFLTGVERRAPRWMQKVALEWLFRLFQSPARLGRRYLLRGPRIFGLLRKMEIRVRDQVKLEGSKKT